MTVLERRARFIQSVMNDTDEVFIKLERVYERISKPNPCMFTVDELRNSVTKFEKDLEEGNVKGVSHKEMKKNMLCEIIWLEDAIEDMEELYDYYAEKSINTAIRIYNGILEEADIIDTTPELSSC